MLRIQPLRIFHNLKIRDRIILMPLIAGAGFVFIVVLVLFLNTRNEIIGDEVQGRYYPLMELSRDFEVIFSDLQRGLQDAVAIGDSNALEDTDLLRDQLFSKLSKANNIFVTERELFEWLRIDFSTYYTHARAITLRMIQGEETTEDLVSELQRMTEQYNHINQALQDNTAHFKDKIGEAFKLEQANYRSLLYWTILTTILGVLLLGWFSYRLASSITKPLNHVVELANTVASGNLDVPIEVYKSDEIGVLKAAFRTMVNEVKMLLKEKDRHLKELNLHRNHLEERVEARTAELKQSNQQLQREIKVREKAEEKQASLLKELQSVNQELKEFAYVVSHDLKAPLRAIGSLSDWLLSDYGDKLDDEGKELVNLLDSRVRRMHNLIEGVLHYSRVGRIREERRNVNLNEALRNAIEMVSPPENMEIRIESDLPVVWVGRTRIEQVFQNLVSNAVKYMDKPKGLIKISCTSDDASWKFCVADNGPGIEEKYFEKIFQIFQTLTPKDEFESTGVGLTLVKKIVEMYGGRIWLESEVGVGTSFFFTLPKMNVNVVDESEVLSECE